MAGHSKILSVYLGLTRLLDPVYNLVVARRKRAGKEHPERSAERFGLTDVPRPAGKLLWMHAASVGETQSLLGLIPALLEARPDLSIVLTSGTVTSAKLLERDLPERAFHQFSPIDTPRAIRRFLDHWQPDLAVWVESEIWPRMLVDTKKRKIPMLLLNARVSPKTLRRWGQARRAAEQLFSLFDHILVQDKSTFALLGDLGVSEERRELSGSLKSELAPALPQGKTAQDLLADLSRRSNWLAASTHEGEEAIVLEAHKALAADHLLILVPRHPERGTSVTALARAEGFVVSQRSCDEPLTEVTQVYVADTLGEMGLWYRATDISFVGGSLLPIGGHNPYEPILLGANVVTGPHVANFSDIYQVLVQAEGCIMAADASALAQAVRDLSDTDRATTQMAAAQACLRNSTSVTNAVRDRVLAHLPAV